MEGEMEKEQKGIRKQVEAERKREIGRKEERE